MRVLVVAAQGDDEALGCGGILSKLNCEKNILIFSINHVDPEKPATFADRVGAKCYWRCNFPDNKFDTKPLLDLIKTLEYYVNPIKPDIIFTHYEHDLNIDHRMTYQAVMTAFRRQKTDIYSFEVPEATDYAFKPFEPNVFVDIDREKKIELLKIYDSEMREPPHLRSYENVKSVERFKLIRKYGI